MRTFLLAGASALALLGPARAADLLPNGVDDTPTINNALTTTHTATLGPGTWRACGITLNNAAFLQGKGAASAIQKTPTCAGPLMSNTDLTASNITLSDLVLNGKGLPGGLINITNDGAYTHGTHNLHDLYLMNDAGDCLTMGYGTRGSMIEHVRVYQCGGFGIKAIGADSEYSTIDSGSTGLAGFYADDSNPHIHGLKIWLAGYGTSDQPGLKCYQCSGLTAVPYSSQDNGGPAFSGQGADHIRLDVASDSDSGVLDGARPAVEFKQITNSRADIVLSHRPAGLGVVSQGITQDPASTGNATSIIGVP